MTRSKIEWTDEVWNPTVGCRRVSEGCRNCYAERMAKRLAAMGRKEYAGLLDESGRWNGQVRMLENRLSQPLRWKRPRRVFVDSMSDLFHEDVPIDFIANVFAVMELASQHTFMILTKRPDRMKAILPSDDFRREYRDCIKILTEATFTGYYEPLDNVWLGVSVENQYAADKRIPYLLETPAAVRFVSCEPLLGPVDLNMGICPVCGGCGELAGHYFQDDGMDICDGCGGSGKTIDKIDWVICGGESGPGARPMHPDWARGLRDQCQTAGVPFFFKQWGEWLPVVEQYGDDDLMDKLDFEAHTICLGNRGTMFSEDRGLERVYWCGYQPDPGQNPWFLERVGKKAAGRELDGRTWEEYPNDYGEYGE